MDQNHGTLVNIKIAGKWMFILQRHGMVLTHPHININKMTAASSLNRHLSVSGLNSITQWLTATRQIRVFVQVSGSVQQERPTVIVLRCVEAADIKTGILYFSYYDYIYSIENLPQEW